MRLLSMSPPSQGHSAGAQTRAFSHAALPGLSPGAEVQPAAAPPFLRD